MERQEFPFVRRMTDRPVAPRLSGAMSKSEQYRQGLETCLANAAKAPFHELRAVWQTMARSYEFLLKLECRSRDALWGHDC
jgi:hypothetical protein